MSLRERMHSFYMRVVDPEERGAGLAFVRGLLLPTSLLYGGISWVRNYLYDAGYLSASRAELPVISVGNITAGGTGKTPFCAWLVGFLQDEGKEPAILSRGYGHDEETGLDDENRLLSSRAPDVPIVVNPDRVEGAATARRHAGADVAVLDDGFQHRRLARDLDIVLVDALLPFGGGHMLPRGILREPLSGLGRADVVVLTRSDMVDRDRLGEIRSRLAELAPDAPVACAAHRPAGLSRLLPGGGRQKENLEELESGPWGAFCGIGNPRGFRGTLEELGADVRSFRAFPDHYRYEADTLRGLMEEGRAQGCERLVTTEKDAGKVSPLLQSLPQTPVYVLQVEMQVTENRGAIEDAVRECVAGGGAGDRAI